MLAPGGRGRRADGRRGGRLPARQTGGGKAAEGRGAWSVDARADRGRARGAGPPRAGTDRCWSASPPTRARPGSSARARSCAHKRGNLFVFNDVSRAEIGFDADENEVVVVSQRANAGSEARSKRGMRGGYPRRGRDPSEGGLMDEQAVGRREDWRRRVPSDAGARVIGRICAGSCTRRTRRSSSRVLCLLAEGHLIIEDFPGVGKTTLAKALARSIDSPSRGSSSRPTCCPRTSPA